ncbi:hypothetical protein Syun_025195 [Stephania yunnanensis]|uniref:RING-type domain-containing protein n=1 Tax=Stephania yunnanensis TaxID=152371 RepID=A0AAP0ETT0_9MAGN
MCANEELLECPVCWESFNVVENAPYVFWCGHTLCRTCVLSLRLVQVKVPTLPIQLPFFVSCPWCQLLSFRLIWKGNIRFPRKNFFLLWLVDNANVNRTRHRCPLRNESQVVQPSSAESTQQSRLLAPSTSLYYYELSGGLPSPRQGRSRLIGSWRVCTSLQKSLSLLVRLTAKFPLVVVFMVIVLYVIPTSAAILIGYMLFTFLFALPSFLVLYLAYPILDWLVREIVA